MENTDFISMADHLDMRIGSMCLPVLVQVDVYY